MSTNVNSKTLIANWVEEVRQSHGKLDWVVLVVNPPPSSLLTLLQRQCAHLEEGNRNKDGTLSTKLHREGHKVLEGVIRVHICTSLYPPAVQGVLSTELDAPAEVGTTVKESYLPPTPPRVRTTGAMVAACLLVFDQSAVITPVYTPPPPHIHTLTHSLRQKTGAAKTATL